MRLTAAPNDIFAGLIRADRRVDVDDGYGGRFPVMRFALIQSGTKKTAVMGTVICTAVVMMTASLYILSRSVDSKPFHHLSVESDLIISKTFGQITQTLEHLRSVIPEYADRRLSAVQSYALQKCR